MPLMIISVLPLILSFVVPLSYTIAIISIINGLLACGDVLAAGMVLCQVPANGTVRNKGWLTYWRQYENNMDHEIQNMELFSFMKQ